MILFTYEQLPVGICMQIRFAKEKTISESYYYVSLIGQFEPDFTSES